MHLVVILLVSLSCGSAEPTVAAAPHQNQQAAPASKPANSDNAPTQGATPSGQNQTKPDAAAAQSSSSPGPAAKKPRQRKKPVSADCNSTGAPATGSTPAGSASSGSARPDASAGGTASPAGAGGSSTNCPPSKVIVRQGGTSEPHIQLAGGPAGEKASQQRDSANQMLGATEQNLEKIAGRDLSASQQDMVNQTRQFMEQAKAALAAEDFDRASTLAWKAQLLSQELANPQK